MLQLSNPFLFYAVHSMLFAAGVFTLLRMERRGASAPMTKLLAGLFLFVAAVFLWNVSNPKGDEIFSDYLRAYYAAGGAVIQGTLPELLKGNYFVNLPVLAWLFVPLAAIAPAQASAYVFLGAGIAVSVVAWLLLVRAARLSGSRTMLLAFLFAASGPLFYNFREGNTSQFALALLAGGFLCLRSGRDLSAGALVGMAALLKLPLLLFAVYFAVRGRGRAFCGMIFLIGVCALASILQFGWPLHVQWFERCVLPFAKEPMAAYNVQSIHGFLARLQSGDRYLLDWDPRPLEPARMWAAKAFTAAAYGLSFVTMARPCKGRAVDELEFLIILVLTLVGSPMTWSHYYLWLLFPAAFLVGNTGHLPRDGATSLLGWVSVALASLPVMLPYTRHAWVMDFFVKFFLSHFLWAGFLMLALLLRARWKIEEAAGGR